MKFVELKSNYPKLSLKKICETIDVCYQYVLKASKQPIPNKPYDPNEVNYDAIEKIIERKNVNLDDYDWKSIEEEMVTVIPVNRIEEFTIGTHFTLRQPKDKETVLYEVVYTTETHIVFKDVSDTQPRVMNYDTFEHQSPRIVKTKEEEGK